MYKYIQYALLSIFWITSLTPSIKAQDAKAKQILDAVKAKYKAYKAFEATFTCNMSSPSTGTNDTYEGKIAVKGSSFRLKLPKQEVLTDGTTQWTYSKDANEVTVNNYSPDPDDITPNKIYEIYESNYEYSYIELKTENGKKYHIIDLKPKNKNAQFFKIRMKITEKYGIKSWELFERNSNRYFYNITKFAEVEVGSQYFKYKEADFPAGHKLEDLR